MVRSNGFQKGHPNYLKCHTEETKKKIGLSNSLRQKGKPKPWLKNKKLTEEHRKKLSEIRKRLFRENKIKPYSHWKGRHHTEATKLKMRESHLGERSYRWNGGITPLNIKIRTSREMRIWKEKVFQRDHYICQECNKIGWSLNAHHIVPFIECLILDYKELLFDVDNGITLCEECHSKTDNYKGLGAYKHG